MERACPSGNVKRIEALKIALSTKNTPRTPKNSERRPAPPKGGKKVSGFIGRNEPSVAKSSSQGRKRAGNNLTADPSSSYNGGINRLETMVDSSMKQKLISSMTRMDAESLP